jgi:hypothetical protein
VTRRSSSDWILRLYPRAWRDRYGDEVRDLVEELSGKREFSTLRVTSGLVVGALVQRVRSWRWSWKTLAVSGVALAFVATLAILFTARGASHPDGTAVGPTKSTIPSSTNGTVDSERVPNFISALGRDGKIAGYIPRAYILPAGANQPSGSGVGAVAPVYASNLKTLVGHFYPGVGFVPLGARPASEPCMPEQTSSRAAGGQTVTSSIACPSTVETVPNVIGTFLPTVMGQLSSDSLQANISYVHSSSVGGGHVISVTPAPGSHVPARSVLIVVSSLGPTPSGVPAPPPTTSRPTRIRVPNTIGLTQAEACATLQKAGLPCRAQTVSSSSVGMGHVLSQAPVPGSYAVPQSTVVITVSSGPSPS